ncbi:MAG: SMP-30/gluconolactonase/LRE family protein [Parvularculaceae bacterium]
MKRIPVYFGFVGAVFAAAAAIVLYTLFSFNYFGRVEHAFEGSCAPVAGVAGPEDLQIDRVRRRAVISSYDRRAEDARGAIYVFDLDDPLSAEGWRDRTGGAPKDFAPVGLSYYEDGDVRRLFVVNAAAQSVELYDVAENGDLAHLETFAERRLTSPNDVAAVGPRAFYVTNDVEGGRDGPLASLQFLARIGSGRILYFDGVAWRTAAEGLRFANGVGLSPDGARAYATETAGETLLVYDRDIDSGVLHLAETVRMNAAPDNINVDEMGVLWIAAHPKPLAIPRLRRDPKARAPSLVLRYRDAPALGAEAAAIYADEGGELSAASAAARFRETMLIGAVFEDKFLICELPD